MFNISIKTFSPGKVDEVLDRVQPIVNRAGSSAMAEMAKQLAERIKEMIPNQGGWFDIYKQSIEFIEINPTEWGVAGIAELPFDKVEAASSLVWFQSGDEAAQLLAPYNPWTIDTIPSVKNGISADLLVRPASESEVDFHRQRISRELGSIDLLLSRIGRQAQENGLPLVNGRIMADIDFLARRLEFGLGGFPRTPVWGRSEAEASNIAKSPEISKTFEKGLGK